MIVCQASSPGQDRFAVMHRPTFVPPHDLDAALHIFAGLSIVGIELVDRAPEMIGMAMCEDDLGDLRLVDPGLLEIVPEFAGRRHETIAGAHINEDQVATFVDHGDVGR